MTSFNASQLYAQLAIDKNEKEPCKLPVKTRQINLRESGEASLLPDIYRCTIICLNTKESLNQVKDSVSRRIDYVVQTLRNHDLKESQYKIHKLLSTAEDGFYKMVAEVVIDFSDLQLYEKVINFLVEKLDKSVVISPPAFIHSPGKLSTLRRQASLNAVQNCRTKALSIAQLLNQTLGSPLSITEEDTTEYYGLNGTASSNSNDSKDSCSLQQQVESHIITVCVKIHAVFECKDRTKKNNK